MTIKQRNYLKGVASREDSILTIGKEGFTTQVRDSVAEALKARELVKINVLKTCEDDMKELADLMADRTRSEVVQVIGRKVVLYKPLADLTKSKLNVPR